MQAILAAQTGDFDNFAVYFHSQRKPLYFHIFAIVKDSMAAEDIVSDCYIRAVGGFRSYNPTSCHINTWLYRIARNLAVDYLRKDSKYDRKESHVLDGKSGNEVMFGIDIETVKKSEAFDRHEILRNLIGELDDTRQQIVRLKFWEGLEYHEIAEKMELPIGTVKGTMHRIKERLKGKCTAMQLA